jgi:HPt (histidine-containing phosphotransfer) domain-containing protein
MKFDEAIKNQYSACIYDQAATLFFEHNSDLVKKLGEMTDTDQLSAALHRIKGSSSMLGLQSLTEAIEVAEEKNSTTKIKKVQDLFNDYYENFKGK